MHENTKNRIKNAVVRLIKNIEEDNLTDKVIARELARLSCIADKEAAINEVQRREISDFCTISGDK